MSDQDLFSADATQGNLAVNSTVSAMAKVIGKFCVIVISVVGFCIVMATIAKNALHGLYAVFPKFWDKVDEAKRANANIVTAFSGDANAVVKFMGSFSRQVLSIFPNIKAMTDFDGEGNYVDAKGYFIKAVPLACVQIFIGYFIFFGYPSKVAEKFSEFGAGLFDVVLANIDPTTWISKLPNEMTRYELSTDGSEDNVDKAVNEITRAVIKTYVSELSDMVAEQRVAVAKQIEVWVIQQANADFAGYCDTDKYKMSVDARVDITEPDLSRVHDKGDGNVHTFSYAVPMLDWQPNTTKAVEGKYIRFDLVFTKKAYKGNANEVTNTLTVAKPVYNGKDKTLTLKICSEAPVGYGFSCLKGAKGTVLIGTEEIKVNISWNETQLIITPAVSGSKSIEQATAIKDISGLKYKYSSNLHPVTKITFGGAGVTFMPTNDSSGIKAWSWGDRPESSNSTGSPSDKVDPAEGDGGNLGK